MFGNLNGVVRESSPQDHKSRVESAKNYMRALFKTAYVQNPDDLGEIIRGQIIKKETEAAVRAQIEAEQAATPRRATWF